MAAHAARGAERRLGEYRLHELFAHPRDRRRHADSVRLDALWLLVYSVAGQSLMTLERLLLARRVLWRVIVEL
ncbi:hypothetical protein GCM10010357_56440 [Streptomyces luteireticuli]|uniref:Uncharacterized protein n=1 Tax=Streptomyces luteireticuli TaxID=173858 RepID=A0ABN0Z0N5_9ACTN